MKRVKKTKPKVSFYYTLLFIADFAFVYNAPLIIKEANTINQYRLNWLIMFVVLMVNGLAICMLEDKKRR